MWQEAEASIYPPLPLCRMQAVFSRQARSTVLYYHAFFAQRDIPAGEELVWDYQTSPGAVACKCGSASCRGKL